MSRKKEGRGLTVPDLVLLSLLAERPMHGYEANLELERRDVRDWAGISRPQVYYSMEKLLRLGMVREESTSAPPSGPDRRVLSTSGRGREVLADALELEHWARQRDRPLFLTWMALSWQARPATFTRQIERRRTFLENELAREQKTLRAIRKEVGEHHAAAWMVGLTIGQFRLELRWLRKLARATDPPVTA